MKKIEAHIYCLLLKFSDSLNRKATFFLNILEILKILQRNTHSKINYWQSCSYLGLLLTFPWKFYAEQRQSHNLLKFQFGKRTVEIIIIYMGEKLITKP